MYREAIAMQRTLLGDDHPEVAAALNNLAFLLYDKGELAVARAMMQESLDIYRRTMGDEHPAVARGMTNIAMWLMEAGNYPDAEPLIRDAIELRRRLLGNDHVDVAASLTLLAAWLIENDRYEEARAAASEARSICLLALDELHWRTAGATSAEGAALAGLGKLAEAEPLLLQGYAVLSEDGGAVPFLQESATRWLADFYRASGDADKEAQYRSRLSGL
jgi:tetratricopeptide (TPR) repeat protein